MKEELLKYSQQEILRALSQTPDAAIEKEIDDLVEEIASAKVAVDTAVQKMLLAAITLRDKVRRTRSDTGSYNRLIYANAYMRLAGAFTQGLKRIGPMERVLARVKGEQEEARLQEVREEKRAQEAAKKRKAVQYSASEDAFDELYRDVVQEENSDAE